MRSLFLTLAGVAFIATVSTAEAKIDITVDKDQQIMTVVVDGVEKFRWPVSSGNPSHETPNGAHKAFRLEEDHYSKEFDEAPMPHSIFFTRRGHAIHGTDSVSRLGSPASHGCVRLSRANAATLFAMVKADGVLNTTVTLTGSSTVALQRNPRGNRNVAKRAPDADIPMYDAAGNLTEPVAAPTMVQPSERVARRPAARVAGDGYIYPADGYDDGRRYPAPRGYRRLHDSSGNVYFYDADGAPARGYAPRDYGNSAPQQRPIYPNRGLFSAWD